MREYFAVMPARYPPLFEDIVSWIAWRNEEPLTIVYVGTDANKPHRVQYLVDTHMAPDTYVSTTPSRFTWKNVPFGSIVFYEQQREKLPPPPLEFSTSATYTDKENNILGKAWTNTDVDLQPALLFSGKNWKNPVPSILLSSALAIIIFVLFTFKFRMSVEKLPEEPGFRIHAEVTLRKLGKKLIERRAKQS